MQNNIDTPDNNSLSTLDFTKIKSSYIDIYSGFDSEFHIGKIFVHLYNEFPSCYTVYSSIEVKQIIQKFTDIYNLTESAYIMKDEYSKQKKISKIDYTNSSYFIKLKEKLFISISSFKIVIWYATTDSLVDINEIKKVVESTQKKKKHNKKFYMIAANSHTTHGYEFKKFDVKKLDIDINENYNDDFFPVHNTIFSFLKEDNKNGLILLHGKYGTGKTTYIRYILSHINRRFIFLPVNMMESISGPNFLPFIAQYKDSVVILEDAEELLMPRTGGNNGNNSLLNLLNMGDGLLADALSIKIICTFNANVKQIDQAILRKGRLVARYEFNELKMDKVQHLWTKLNYEGVPEKDMSLAELYNKNNTDFGEISKTKKMGF